VTFANRPRFPSLQLISFDGAVLSTSSYGPYWRNLRRVAALHLLSAHRVGLMSATIAAEVRAMVRRMNHAAASSSDGATRVQLKRRLFEVSLSVLVETIAQTKTSSRTEASAETDMSPEATELRQIFDAIVPNLSAANLWDYLPVLRWFDVSGARNKLKAAVSSWDKFLQRLVDAKRQSLDDDSESDKKSMISVLLSLQKTEPDVYTDTVIKALCAVSGSSNLPIIFTSLLTFDFRNTFCIPAWYFLFHIYISQGRRHCVLFPQINDMLATASH
jgi:hypothetical protein